VCTMEGRECWTDHLVVHATANEANEGDAGLRQEEWPDEGAGDGSRKGQMVVVRGQVGCDIACWETVAEDVVSCLERE